MLEAFLIFLAIYLTPGILIALTLGRMYAAVPLWVVVLVWPEFLRQNRNWNRLP